MTERTCAVVILLTLAVLVSGCPQEPLPIVSVWPFASPITYGQTLASSTLSGGFSYVAGTFGFAEPEIAPDAGTYRAAVIFTPLDTSVNQPETGAVNVTVRKATPTVTQWPTASPITYGQTVADSTLTGGAASVPGSFAFASPGNAPPPGNFNEVLIFTPTDVNNYVPVSGETNFTVAKIIPNIITWPTASSIKYGQSLASSTLAGGAASVQGIFQFLTPDTTPDVGTYVASLQFVPDDTFHYGNVAGTIDVIVEQLFLYVKSGSTGDGTSWDAAFGTIQEALDAATGGEEIWVAAGTYSGGTDAVVAMKNKTSIFGGFAGTESLRNERDWTLNETVIDGQHLRTAVHGASKVTVDGLVIQNGHTTGNGGGMCLVNCDNVAVSNCIFRGNQATNGGGIYITYGESITLTNCTFIDNVADQDQMYKGGAGIYVDTSSTTVVDSTFIGNRAGYGGGIYGRNYQSMTMEDCTFAENTAWWGAGMYNDNSSCYESAEASIRNCTFTDNSANVGGGISNNNYCCTPVITNCLFARNTAHLGGGIADRRDAHSTLINCTFIDNLASSNGGGFLNDSTGTSTVTNCVFWGNAAPSEEKDVYAETTSSTYTSHITVTYSCVENGYDGVGNISTNPLFVDQMNGNYCLRLGSPCVDSGTSANAPDTDSRGLARPLGAGVDMGAFELDDADTDGMSDLWEQSSLGTVDAQPDADPDHDGLTNLEEFHASSDPTQADSDNDGSTDHQELENGTNPLLTTVVRRVNPANMSGMENGLSWSTAFRSIQDAIDAVHNTGDGEVWVAKGTYTGTSDSVVAMERQVHLFGGFAGTETARNQRAWATNRSIIDGGGARKGVLGANYATLDGFVVQNGEGGGVYNLGVSPTVRNCIITGNSADTGAGMYNAGASPIVENCTIAENTAYHTGGMHNLYSLPTVTNCTFADNLGTFGSNIGGGMCNDHSSSTVTNCTFSQNQVWTYYAGTGAGGMYNYFASPTVSGCTFSSNTAASAIYSGSGAGGMFNDNSSPTITNCVFDGNVVLRGSYDYTTGGMLNTASTVTMTGCSFSANYGSEGGGMWNTSGSSVAVTGCAFNTNSARYGGGMYNDSSTAAITHCTFADNTAEYGAGMLNQSSLPTVVTSTFQANIASYGGGGIMNYSSSATLSNCLFTDNDGAGYGGGVCNSSSSPTLINCTFAGNTAGLGGGMSGYDFSNATAVNCIFWADSASTSGNELFNEYDEYVPSTTLATYSCIEGGYEGTANISANPLFTDATNGDFSLQAGSPCIDHGTPEGAPDTDIAGQTRPQGSGYDMGAYEHAEK